ncbi:MAG: hypothetical protein AUI15_26315 [Actinobacteria bacterium 13_2_20CM_2_66_6]|nr:MAG: hypothetical protein AUI15_26315 [Actinobacteria bacterium 13_2_20CM_2_66_6]
MTAITSRGSLREAMTSMADSTAAAPDISSFIRLMFSGSLSEMPPVSKVIPFPTRASTEPLPAAESWLP